MIGESADLNKQLRILNRTARWCSRGLWIEADPRHVKEVIKALGLEARTPGLECIEEDKDTDKDVDADRDRTGRPVVIGQPTGSSTPFKEVDIDFRVSGLPHAVVKQAEYSRVRELVKRIENHPHRQDLQTDLQRNNADKPFSEKSKKMIKDMGNVELFELCETIPKVRCKECLLYWIQGIVYYTCGHLLRENQSSRSILQWTLDLLSIPNYVIKKVRHHGNRPKEHFIAHNLRRRCIKKGFEGIHDRFHNDSTFRESLLSIDRTEEVCIQMDKDAQKDFTYRMTEDEFFRYKKNGWISLNKSGKIGPMRDRSDFNEALIKLHRLHQESGEERLAPISYWQYQTWHPSSSSSSTSWWQTNDSLWSS